MPCAVYELAQLVVGEPDSIQSGEERASSPESVVGITVGIFRDPIRDPDRNFEGRVLGSGWYRAGQGLEQLRLEVLIFEELGPVAEGARPLLSQRIEGWETQPNEAHNRHGSSMLTMPHCKALLDGPRG